MIGVFAYILGSVIMIAILHNLYNYMSELFAPRKVKHISDLYSKKYHEIHETLKNSLQPYQDYIMDDSSGIDAEEFASDIELEMLVNGLNMANNKLPTDINDSIRFAMGE